MNFSLPNKALCHANFSTFVKDDTSIRTWQQTRQKWKCVIRIHFRTIITNGVFRYLTTPHMFMLSCISIVGNKEHIKINPSLISQPKSERKITKWRTVFGGVSMCIKSVPNLRWRILQLIVWFSPKKQREIRFHRKKSKEFPWLRSSTFCCCFD